MLRKNVERSLDRLQYFFRDPEVPLKDLIPAFYYTVLAMVTQADLLLKYSKEYNENSIESQNFFRKFSANMDELVERDFTGMVRNASFRKCMRSRSSTKLLKLYIPLALTAISQVARMALPRSPFCRK